MKLYIAFIFFILFSNNYFAQDTKGIRYIGQTCILQNFIDQTSDSTKKSNYQSKQAAINEILVDFYQFDSIQLTLYRSKSFEIQKIELNNVKTGIFYYPESNSMEQFQISSILSTIISENDSLVEILFENTSDAPLTSKIVPYCYVYTSAEYQPSHVHTRNERTYDLLTGNFYPEIIKIGYPKQILTLTASTSIYMEYNKLITEIIKKPTKRLFKKLLREIIKNEKDSATMNNY